MKADRSTQLALINILNGIYSEIHSIEEQLQIRIDESDFRPRIEYFHDAVRALTTGSIGSKRLSVEFLSYDVAMLRYIQANPLARPKGSKLNLSPGTALITGNEPEYITGRNSTVKAQLIDLYKNYSVLFVALLSEPADHDYYSKVESCNEEVENIAVIQKAAKAAARNESSEVNIEDILHQYMDDPNLARKILAQIGGNAKKAKAGDALKKLSEMMKAADKKIKDVEQAHFTYRTSQLAIYENARDVVRKMAVSGMNIVGNFVESAVQEAKGTGRGM